MGINICTGTDESSLGFWREVKSTNTGDNTEAFPTLKGLLNIRYIYFTTYSSGRVERIFSAITINKHKISNKLCTGTLFGLLYTKMP